jgi:hypothetical protein
VYNSQPPLSDEGSVLDPHVTKAQLIQQVLRLDTLSIQNVDVDFIGQGCRLYADAPPFDADATDAYLTPLLTKREMWCFVTGAITALKNYV